MALQKQPCNFMCGITDPPPPFFLFIFVLLVGNMGHQKKTHACPLPIYCHIIKTCNHGISRMLTTSCPLNLVCSLRLVC